MLKKWLMAAAALVTLAACGTDEFPEEPVAGTGFVGTVTVTNPRGTFEQEAIWRFDVGGGKSGCLYMDRTRFVAEMPYLDMEVRGIPLTEEPGTVVFRQERIVPYYAGEPYPAYVMTDFEGALEADRELRVAFTCMGMQVVFEGARAR